MCERSAKPAMSVPTMAVEAALAHKTHSKAMAAMQANSEIVDSSISELAQAGIEALTEGAYSKATTRFSEVLRKVDSMRGEVLFENTSAFENTASTTSAFEKRPTTPRKAQNVEFSHFSSACAACGTLQPREHVWLGCMACHQVRYCSAQCRRDAWSWGHSHSCAAAAPPPATPAAIAALSAEAAVRTLSEYGRANSELALCCFKRILVHLEGVFEGPTRPSADWLRERAAAHARRACPVTPGAVLPDFGVTAFESSIRKAVMSWGRTQRATRSNNDDGDGALARAPASSDSDAASVWLSTMELGVAAAVPVMRVHERDVNVTRLGVRLLALGAQFGARLHVVRLGGLAAIVRVLSAHPATLANECMRAFEAIALGEGQAIIDGMLTPCALPVRVLVPGVAADDAAIATEANPMRHAQSRTALEACVEAMTNQPSAVISQRSGVTVLARLGTGCGSSALCAVRAAGGLPVVTAAMLKHAADADLNEAGVKLLLAVATAAEVPGQRRGAAEVYLQNGAVEALVNAMRTHTTRAALQRDAAATLVAAASISDRARLTVFGHAGCRTAVVHAMRLHPEIATSCGLPLPDDLIPTSPRPKSMSGGMGSGGMRPRERASTQATRLAVHTAIMHGPSRRDELGRPLPSGPPPPPPGGTCEDEDAVRAALSALATLDQPAAVARNVNGAKAPFGLRSPRSCVSERGGTAARKAQWWPGRAGEALETQKAALQYAYGLQRSLEAAAADEAAAAARLLVPPATAPPRVSRAKLSTRPRIRNGVPLAAANARTIAEMASAESSYVRWRPHSRDATSLPHTPNAPPDVLERPRTATTAPKWSSVVVLSAPNSARASTGVADAEAAFAHPRVQSPRIVPPGGLRTPRGGSARPVLMSPRAA